MLHCVINCDKKSADETKIRLARLVTHPGQGFRASQSV